jgi:uncharacterized membrane protein YeaQ/YmgE (transglycosylase-associated protein family)
MEGLTPIILQLISGAVGGNVGGALAKARSLGPVWNSVLGIIGGLVGGQGANALGVDQAGGQMGIAAVVGALLPIIVGMFKKPTA